MKRWWTNLAFWKAISDGVILIFLLGIATNSVTQNFYKVMIVPLLIGLLVTILYILKNLMKKD